MNIVLLDDNLAIRQAIRHLVKISNAKTTEEINLYTSSNGVEGLGYVFVIKPQIIIIDSTLPKYSGRELVEFLATNSSFHQDGKQIFVLADNVESKMDLPSNFKILDKSAKDFFDNLTAVLNFEKPSGFKKFLIKNSLQFAHKSDKSIQKATNAFLLTKIFYYFVWLMQQLVVSLNLSILNITNGRTVEDNVVQSKIDARSFRVKYYPTLVTFLTALIVFLLQLCLFLAGSIVIFNTEITSVLGSA